MNKAWIDHIAQIKKFGYELREDYLDDGLVYWWETYNERGQTLTSEEAVWHEAYAHILSKDTE
jgi:hypothetical protein